jgi:serine/threonine protein kinase/tetratricopeptide (TPR) repeat protein
MNELTIGDLFESRYLIEKCLGEGGMGAVFKATDQQRGDLPCAIKVLKEVRKGESQYLKRFETELLIMTRLKHPHIVEVFDAAQQTRGMGVRYIVMELLEGESLGEIIERKEALKLSEVIRLTSQILSALDYAHRAGVIHRDLKPDNLFVCRDDRGERVMKILDFGIAKDLESDLSLTASVEGAMVGTPRYMSPEQMQNLNVSAKSDLYAIGVILYQLITGALLFENDGSFVPAELQNLPASFQIAWMHMNAAPPPLQQVPTLSPIIESALAKAQGDRPADARDFRNQLKHWLKQNRDIGDQWTPLPLPSRSSSNHPSPSHSGSFTPSGTQRSSSKSTPGVMSARHIPSSEDLPRVPSQPGATHSSPLTKRPNDRIKAQQTPSPIESTGRIHTLRGKSTRRPAPSIVPKVGVVLGGLLLIAMMIKPLFEAEETDSVSQPPSSNLLTQKSSIQDLKGQEDQSALTRLLGDDVHTFKERAQVIDQLMKGKLFHEAFSASISLPLNLKATPTKHANDETPSPQEGVREPPKIDPCVDQGLRTLRETARGADLSWELEETLSSCAHQQRSSTLLDALIQYWDTRGRWAEVKRSLEWRALWAQWSLNERQGRAVPNLSAIVAWISQLHDAPLSPPLIATRALMAHIEHKAPSHPVQHDLFLQEKLTPIIEAIPPTRHAEMIEALWKAPHPTTLSLGILASIDRDPARASAFLSRIAPRLSTLKKREGWLSYALQRLEARAWMRRIPHRAISLLSALPDQAHTEESVSLHNNLLLDASLYADLVIDDPPKIKEAQVDSADTSAPVQPSVLNEAEGSSKTKAEWQTFVEAHLTRALKRWPKSDALTLNRALLNAKSAQRSKRRSALKVAKSYSIPLIRSSETAHRVGQTFMRLGESSKALKAFHRADRTDPSHQAQAVERAQVYFKARDYTRVVQCFERLAQAEVSVPSSGLVIYAKSLMGLKRSAKATETLRAYLRDFSEGAYVLEVERALKEMTEPAN